MITSWYMVDAIDTDIDSEPNNSWKIYISDRLCLRNSVHSSQVDGIQRCPSKPSDENGVFTYHPEMYLINDILKCSIHCKWHSRV